MVTMIVSNGILINVSILYLYLRIANGLVEDDDPESRIEKSVQLAMINMMNIVCGKGLLNTVGIRLSRRYSMAKNMEMDSRIVMI